MASEGYSARVLLQLVVGDTTLSLSHVGPKGLVVRDECQAIEPDFAILRITVNDTVEDRKVFLPHGVPGPREMISFW